MTVEAGATYMSLDPALSRQVIAVERLCYDEFCIVGGPLHAHCRIGDIDDRGVWHVIYTADVLDDETKFRRVSVLDQMRIVFDETPHGYLDSTLDQVAAELHTKFADAGLDFDDPDALNAFMLGILLGAVAGSQRAVLACVVHLKEKSLHD